MERWGERSDDALAYDGATFAEDENVRRRTGLL
jgi:hypothetical protein